jgi:hypothetical protein
MAGLRNPKPAFYAATVGHIYEAALDPQRWQDVLGALDHLYPEARITFFGHRNGRGGAGFAFRKNFDEDDLRVYFDHFIKNSPFLERIERCPVGQPCYSEAMISDDELYRTEYYNDYMRSRRLGHYAAGIVFERTPVATTALSSADRKDDTARIRSARSASCCHTCSARFSCTASSVANAPRRWRRRLCSIAGRTRPSCSTCPGGWSA